MGSRVAAANSLGIIKLLLSFQSDKRFLCRNQPPCWRFDPLCRWEVNWADQQKGQNILSFIFSQVSPLFGTAGLQSKVFYFSHKKSFLPYAGYAITVKDSIFFLSFFSVETHTLTNLGCSCMFITQRLSFIAAGKKWAKMPAVNSNRNRKTPLEGPLQRTAIGGSAVLAQHSMTSDQCLQIVAALFHLDKNTFSWKEGSLTFVQQPFLLAEKKWMPHVWR